MADQKIRIRLKAFDHRLIDRSASEIVVPVLAPSGGLIAVLDVDATETAAFDAVDAAALERLMTKVFGAG